VIKIFRSGNPINAVFLLIYALAIKSFFIIHPSAPLLNNADGFLFVRLIYYLNWLFGKKALYFTLLAVALLFMQAMQLNRLVNYFRLLPGNTFLPAMSYLLLTSFFKDWNYFSAALLTNSFLLIALVGMARIYNRASVKGMVFNIGFVIGLAVLFYFPAVIFFLLLWMVLAINRPFHLSEWIIAVLGILCPFYFYGTYLFLTNHFSKLWHRAVFWGWTYPVWYHINWIIGAIAIIMCFFIYGGLKLQQNFFKTLIHVRKIWLILLTYTAVAILVPFLNRSFSVNTWILALVPVAAYTANAWWNIKKNWLATILQLGLIAFVFCAAIFG
jgi:hypothetical protein